MVDLGHLPAMGPWQELLPILLIDAPEVHIRCAEDFGQSDQVKKALRSLLTGTSNNSGILDQLECIKRCGFKLKRVVTEISASTLASQIDTSGRLITTRQLIRAHYSITQTIRGALGLVH